MAQSKARNHVELRLGKLIYIGLDDLSEIGRHSFYTLWEINLLFQNSKTEEELIEMYVQSDAFVDNE